MRRQLWLTMHQSRRLNQRQNQPRCPQAGSKATIVFHPEFNRPKNGPDPKRKGSKELSGGRKACAQLTLALIQRKKPEGAGAIIRAYETNADELGVFAF